LIKKLDELTSEKMKEIRKKLDLIFD